MAPTKSWRSGAGFALLLVVSAMTLIGGIVAAATFVVSAESSAAANFRDARAARYAADAGTEYAAALLRQGAEINTWLSGAGYRRVAPALGDIHPGDVSIPSLAVALNMANCSRRSLCSDAAMTAVSADRPWGTNNPRWQGLAEGWLDDLLGVTPSSSPFYLLITVADDGGESDGNPEADGPLIDGRPLAGAGRVLVRSAAFGPRGSASTVEVLLEQRPREPPLWPRVLRLRWSLVR